MDKLHFEQRREKARACMRKAGLAALVVSLDANRFYLSGFELHDPQANESAGCLALMADGADWLCTDGRFFDAARRIWDEQRIFIYRGQAMEQVNALLRNKARGIVGFEARQISVEAFDLLAPGLSLQRADGLVESLRLIKAPEEIRRLQASCLLNHKLMDHLPAILLPGRSEAEVAWDIERFFRDNGAREAAFSGIVAVGANAALPHAEPGEDRIEENSGMLIDVGCRVEDYCSDQTRSFWVGDAPDKEWRRHLDLVQEAQALAIQGIRPGADLAGIYGLARKRLDEAGLGELFTHGLGHGIGLQTHEAPSLNPRAQGVLKAGMVVTVEPGLYVSGRSGVRWEHMVLVTEDGAVVL
ncbi:MAG: aminopeptidase P family protein [Deltaproteobacteria bacterium]|jgi:Xaa-Pro aminopeptidase|nr:aminopeptidase P family protein [Deltaproteobacteria bacterium]